MTQKKRDTSSALLALTASAMALPGIVDTVRAATAEDQFNFAYRYSTYHEGDIDRSKVSGDVRERYEIDVNQFQVIAPIGSRFQVTADAVHEKMSGASPQVIIPDANGDPIQVMSGATIEDTRVDGSLKLESFGDKNVWTGTFGVSNEDDYRAYNASLTAQTDINERQTTLSTGIGASLDEINPTGGGTTQFPLRVESEDKYSLTAFGGVSHIINPNSSIQTSLSVTHLNGFLSDPYKSVFVVDTILADNRPDNRTQLTSLTRYRYFFDRLNAAVNVDYRFYYDDWEVSSHTFDFAWHQNFGHGWQVTPSFRYYSQGQAQFYSPFFTSERADGFYSSDYRLSPYGAISGRIKVKKDLDRWQFNIAAEHYTSSGNLALGNVEVENPSLLDFTIFSMGVNFKL